MITCKPEQQCSVLCAVDLGFVCSSAPVKADIHKNAFRGKVVSIQRIADCGHLAPLVQPDIVADAISNILRLLRTPAKSRL
jgi:pimeloyl-ACP methyl ester carboxylesterase